MKKNYNKIKADFDLFLVRLKHTFKITIAYNFIAYLELFKELIFLFSLFLFVVIRLY